ncbi:DsbA family protein [Psychromonas ossibalaenae]|uniref:DsbA family protein n=1 Tax=Psychromonas ossibalaenae TaxID=444922 RepID=UPI0005274819|nr:DsbA family protein [Psychromonas ossibalaenae]
MTRPILYYVYDPMCSWCWGYRPTWLALQEQLKTTLEIRYRVGGLAPDSDELMPVEMQTFLQQTWQKISSELGTQFNFDFWRQCQPRRSTYPACRAVLIAREAGLEQAMYCAVQQAYYLHAKNPSDSDLLVELAVSVGINGQLFEQKLNSVEINQQLLTEIEQARKLPIQGFPSLVLAVNNQLFPIPVDYKHWQSSYEAITSRLLIAD